MGTILIIIGISVIVSSILGIILINLYTNYKDVRDMYFKLKNKPSIKKYPLYVKLDSNLNPRVYKLKDIMIVPQNSLHAPELCLVITGKDKNGATYNATIEKFVIATEEEYNKNKKDELEF